MNYETWRPVPTFESWYEVSDLGRFRRIAPGGPAKVGHILALSPNKTSGYLYVHLCRSASDRRHIAAHTLVAKAFLGPYPPKHEVNHIDGDKTNIKASNLEYVTKSKNRTHAKETLGIQFGYFAHLRTHGPSKAKLTEAQVLEIRRLSDDEGYTQSELSRMYGISRTQVRHIVQRKSWKRI